MRIMVTGGAGMIGSNLCRRLLAEGHEVLCIDNFYSGLEENISELFDNQRFRFIMADIGVFDHNLECDRIYHLACPASPPFYQKDGIYTLDTSIDGMRKVLNHAVFSGARVLFTSTSEVYGDPAVHPQVESYRGNVNTYGVRSCYDEGKRVCESYCFEFRRMHSVDTKVVRIFNTFGPFMRPDDGRVVSNFIMQALQGIDLTVYGDGSQTRSLCYVDDTVEALVRVMESDAEGPLNVGNPVEITMNDLASTIIGLVGSRSGVVHMPLPKDDPTKRKPDIAAIGEAVGWEPSVDYVEGLRKTIAFFRERYM